MGLPLSEKQKELVNYYLEVTKKYPKNVVGIRVIKDSLTPSINGYYLFIKDGDNSQNLTKVNGRTVKALIDKKYLVKKEGLYLFNLKETSQKEKLEQKLEYLKEKFKNRDSSGYKSLLALKVDITRVEYALEGRDFDKERELKRKQIESNNKKLDLEEKESEDRALALSKQTEFTLPDGLINEMDNTKFDKYNKNYYRGENSEYRGTGHNTGVSMFGQGLYTTNKHSYAKLYGKVRTVDPYLELPSVPLKLKSSESFSFFEQKFCEEHGIMKKHLHLVGDISEVIVKMGYDGLTLHQSNAKIIVKYI